MLIIIFASKFYEPLVDTVDMANDNTPVIEDLARVKMGSTAISSIRIGGRGTAKYARAKPIVGSTATPFKPADACLLYTSDAADE